MRVFCVSWHFPPSSEIAGKVVYRFTRALAARGHHVTVVTIPGSASVAQDYEFAADVSGVDVVRVAPWPRLTAHAVRWKKRLLGRSPTEAGGGRADPEAQATRQGALVRRFLELRNLPDHGNNWIVPARRMLRRMVREQHPDLLLSISPLFSAHLVALDVHRAFPALPWWTWSHDPASGNPFGTDAIRFREKLLSRWEAKVAREATGMCVTTEEIAAEFERRYRRRPSVIMCGYDQDDVPAYTRTPASGPMILIHAGTLYGHRTPVPLLEAVAQLRRAGRLGSSDLRLRLVGDATDLLGESPRDAVRRLDLGDLVTVESVMSHADALGAIAASHVGVLLAEGQPLQVPAKTFDYVALRRPILALADGATAAFIERHHLGVTATRSTMLEALERLVDAFRKDRLAALTGQVESAAPALTMAAQVARFEHDVAIPRPAVGLAG